MSELVAEAPGVTDPLRAPASSTAPPASARDGATALPALSANGASIELIPTPALVAYQRAEVVLGGADAACHLDWRLLAAIGRIESDHGHHGTSRLDERGLARPAIIGVPLNGVGPVAAIADTDAGMYDGDREWDRAVGPLQFLPSTWSAVGVDADGDGRRNPQDIDDAALGAAVHLCSGATDLGSLTGRAEALRRYNPSDAYVRAVLAWFSAYSTAEPLRVNAMPTLTRYDDELAAPAVKAVRKPAKATAAAPAGPVPPVPPVPLEPTPIDSAPDPDPDSTVDPEGPETAAPGCETDPTAEPGTDTADPTTDPSTLPPEDVCPAAPTTDADPALPIDPEPSTAPAP